MEHADTRRAASDLADVLAASGNVGGARALRMRYDASSPTTSPATKDSLQTAEPAGPGDVRRGSVSSATSVSSTSGSEADSSSGSDSDDSVAETEDDSCI